MIQSFDAIQFELLTAQLNKRLTNSDIIHLEEQPTCSRRRSWMQTDAMKICWKLRIPGCRRADPKQLRQPAGAGEHDGALSIRALGSTHYTARSTGFESCSPHSRNHVFQDNGLKSPSQSNNQQMNKNAKPVDKNTVDTLPDNGWLEQLLYSYCNPLYDALRSIRWTPTF